MKLPINAAFAGLIQSTLSHTGGQILYKMLEEAAKRAESLFDKDNIPESFRVGATYSHIVSTKDYSYCFTLLRDQNGIWSLTAFTQGETLKPVEAIPC